MQSVNGAQFVSALFAPLSSLDPVIVIVPLISIYMHHYNHLNLTLFLSFIGLLFLYVPRDSSFISNQFLVLYLDGLFCVLSNKIIIF